MQHFRWQPDLVNWHKEASGRYVSNDGLSTCQRGHSGAWTCAIRCSIDTDWHHSPYHWGALHAAQDECRRMHTKALQPHEESTP